MKHVKGVEVAHFRDDEEFECLPYSSEERVCNSWNLKDAEFVFVYLTLFKDLEVRLPFTNFEYGVLVQLNVIPTQLYLRHRSLL